jgi:mannose PTS system EIIA component
MIGIVIVTHGALATAFCAALEHIVGKQEHLIPICIDASDDIAQKRQDILEAVRQAEKGHGVVVLTDMFGGTPSNLAIAAMGEKGVEVLAGLNLPLLVKLAKVRHLPLSDALTQAQEAGRKYIKVASNVLSES